MHGRAHIYIYIAYGSYGVDMDVNTPNDPRILTRFLASGCQPSPPESTRPLQVSGAHTKSSVLGRICPWAHRSGPAGADSHRARGFAGCGRQCLGAASGMIRTFPRMSHEMRGETLV